MSNEHSKSDAPANPSQQKVHAALDEIERVGARSRLTIRAGIKAGAASVRPAVCYGCAPPDL